MQEVDIKVLQPIYAELHASGVFSSNCQLVEIIGGAVNKSYQLIDNQRRYFVKIFSPDELGGIDRRQQFLRQKELAKLGLAPQPCYLSNKHQFQVDDWVEGQSLLDEQVDVAHKYRQLARSLLRIHKLGNTPILNFLPLDLPQKWQEYIAIAKLKLSAAEQLNISQWTDIWYSADNANHGSNSCVCHNDLSLQHVLLSPSEVIFDWEYAAFSNRYFDIASSLLVNTASIECEQILLLEYANLSDLPLARVISQVGLMKPLVEFTNKLWFMAADKQASLN
ncbi:phosphotransferase [Paraglaciecola aquimarina]|uniref:Phosphotransferase n=1 Tax=Paraglaciecola aquimarina TaxID=1235557 RepID=A0ABU3SZZ2_9ALTE|nr:phosphotransferase [Paraglaciecola aquimarina]MDU0355585.1 phosphotransferase [Paraglaciecola aquimarina]